jgi:hypothetical protein
MTNMQVTTGISLLAGAGAGLALGAMAHGLSDEAGRVGRFDSFDLKATAAGLGALTFVAGMAGRGNQHLVSAGMGMTLAAAGTMLLS